MIDAPIISNICYGPSYISFEYALSYYGLIPEKVSIYTCTAYNKNKSKIYKNKLTSFSYLNIPNAVFPFGITYLINEEGIKYKIATKEKALCDTLYEAYPIRSIKDLKILLFEDLRIDEIEFMKLNFNFIIEIGNLYHSNTINTLVKYLMKIKKEKNHRKFNKTKI